MDSTGKTNSSVSSHDHFATTSWTMVNRAVAGDTVDSRDALETLCRVYWYPLYAFVRRKGYPRDQAEDLTQAFFTELLEKRKLDIADESRGRFRSFLLTSLDHFVKNQWRSEQALKRGGGKKIFSIDFESADRRFVNEPADESTAEKMFERTWALAVLNQSLASVRQQYEQANKLELFEALKIYLGQGTPVPYRDVAQQLGMKEGAIKVAVFRLRERYGEQLRLQIARTIDDSMDVDDELSELFNALT